MTKAENDYLAMLSSADFGASPEQIQAMRRQFAELNSKSASATQAAFKDVQSRLTKLAFASAVTALVPATAALASLAGETYETGVFIAEGAAKGALGASVLESFEALQKGSESGGTFLCNLARTVLNDHPFQLPVGVFTGPLLRMKWDEIVNPQRYLL